MPYGQGADAPPTKPYATQASHCPRLARRHGVRFSHRCAERAGSSPWSESAFSARRSLAVLLHVGRWSITGNKGMTIVATLVRLRRGTPTHPRCPLATRGGTRYSLRLVAAARARAPIDVFGWSLLRLPSLKYSCGGVGAAVIVFGCHHRPSGKSCCSRPSAFLRSAPVRVALFGLLRPVCCRARHTPPRTSGRAVGATRPFFSARALSLRHRDAWVSPSP